MSKRVLIFAPHPDDAELGMGGTIVWMIERGWEVVLADVTNGEPTPAGSVEIREAETAAASKALGITQRLCVGLENRRLENTLENRRRLAEVIRQYRPEWLFTVSVPDAHPDHVHLHELVNDARFDAKLTKTDMAYEPHYPKKILYFYATHLRVNAEPRFVVDVSGQWDKKVAAIEAYQSQFWDNQPAERRGWIVEYVTTLARYYGSRIGVEYGEAFLTYELVGLGDLGSLR